jgi:hypothetical protein
MKRKEADLEKREIEYAKKVPRPGRPRHVMPDSSSSGLLTMPRRKCATCSLRDSPLPPSSVPSDSSSPSPPRSPSPWP